MSKKFMTGGLIIAVTLLAFVACGSGDQQTANKADDEQLTQQKAGSAETDKPASEQLAAQDTAPPAQPVKQPEAKPKPRPKKETPPPAPATVTVPTGTALAVALDTKLRTDSNAVGDPVSATLSADLALDGKTIVPAGSKLQGQLTAVEEPHRTQGKAQMTIQFDKVVMADGRTLAIATAPLAFEAEGDAISDEAKVGAGAVIGGAIGALTSKKKGKGAAVGAAIGAAAGGAVAVATKGKQLELAAGSPLTVEVSEATTWEVPK
ncbi:MAG TPA: hypothetical protein VLB27_01555 [candidate division Zixibacteria bacterium]|nr:hypothetical protein [candidate division Zixibacteria bacterium]